MDIDKQYDGLTLNLYQQTAMGFRLDTADEIYALLNLSGEVGELLSLYAKARRDGMNPELREKAVKELGDVMWMCAAVAADLEVSLGVVAFTNLSKLQGRKLRDQIKGSGDER